MLRMNRTADEYRPRAGEDPSPGRGDWVVMMGRKLTSGHPGQRSAHEDRRALSNINRRGNRAF
jgi:hypothetical protein